MALQRVTLHLNLLSNPFLPPANEVWGKVIFSVTCVKNSVERGGGIPACLAGDIPACLAGEIPACLASLQGVLQTHAGGRGVSRPTPGEGKFPGPYLGGVSRPTPREGGWCIPACTEANPSLTDGYCCGRYASYWNAFLY